MVCGELLARLRGGVQFVLDIRHGISPTITGCCVECECALPVRMRVVVSANAGGAALRPLAPVCQQSVAKQHAAVGSAQTRFVPGGAFPDAKIVADERISGLTAKELARDQSVLFVHAGIDPGIDL